jgi:hypothetical protein
MPSPFLEDELEVLDRCAAEAGSWGGLLRCLIDEPIRTRSAGRVALRQALESHLERSAVERAEVLSRATPALAQRR